MKYQTLVLNKDGTPLSVVNERRGLRLILKSQNIQPLEFYDKHVPYGRGSVQVPAVVIYTKYVLYDVKKMPNKKLVIKRDGFICQYCGTQMQEHEATVDHIKPVESFKHRGLANTWENMVAACRPCNFKKANKPLDKCGLKLRKRPRPPTREDIFNFHNPPKEWHNYLRKK